MARRVNKRFLIVLTVVVVGGGAAAVAAQKLLWGRDPKPLIDEGDRAMAAGDYETAVERYRRAAGRKMGDPTILDRLGDAWNARAGESVEFLSNARGAWNSAVASDASYAPALQKLLDSFVEQAEVYPADNPAYVQIRDYATKLLALDSGNKRATAYLHLATVKPWLANVPTSTAEVDKSVQAQ